MWESLQGNSEKDEKDIEPTEDSLAPSMQATGFGGVKGGFGRSFGMGRGRGRGIERDAKGKDWECPSCTNLNWSWRSNCNKCDTAKPASILVCLLIKILNRFVHFNAGSRLKQKFVMVLEKDSTKGRIVFLLPLSKSTKKDLMILVEE